MADEREELWKEYVRLLSGRLGELEVLAYLRGLRCPEELVRRGAELRQKLGISDQQKEADG